MEAVGGNATLASIQFHNLNRHSKKRRFETPNPTTNPFKMEPASPERKHKRRQHAFYLALAVAFYAVVQVYVLLSPILLSFILILLITLALNPIVTRLRNWTGGRRRATGLILVGVLALCGLTVWGASAPLKDAVTTLSERLPAYWERLQKPLIKLQQKAAISEVKMQDEVTAEIEQETPEAEKAAPKAAPSPPPHDDQTHNGGETIRSRLIGMIRDVLGRVKGLALNTTRIFIVLVTVFFGVTFTMMNPRPIFGAVFSVVPERHHPQTLVIAQRIARFVPRWAMSVLISMVTIGSLFFALMWPIFGFSDALMLGLIACLLSAIPFLGPILSLIPALLLAIGEGGMTPVWVLLAYLAVQTLEGNVITPLIMSRGLKLHPMAIMFSMLLSVAAFGVLGLLIAAPMVAILGILHEELYRKRFLPTATDDDLDRLARGALLDNSRVSPHCEIPREV